MSFAEDNGDVVRGADVHDTRCCISIARTAGMKKGGANSEIIDEMKQHWQLDRLSEPAATKLSHGFVFGPRVMLPQMSPTLHTAEVQ